MRHLLATALMCVSLPIQAQNANLQTRPYQTWPIWRDFIEPYQKILPPGFYHFQPVSESVAALRFDGRYFVVCKESYDDPNNPGKNAISFARQLWTGNTPLEAVDTLKRAHGGTIPCGFRPSSTYAPFEVSVRGDDKTRKVFLLKLYDETNNIWYMGVPKTWE